MTLYINLCSSLSQTESPRRGPACGVVRTGRASLSFTPVHLLYEESTRLAETKLAQNSLLFLKAPAGRGRVP